MSEHLPPGVPADVAENTLFDWVHTSKLFVAPYGRKFSQKKVDGLRKNWDPKAIGVLYTSYRRETDNHALLDGQHRHVAGTQEEMEWFPCRVYIDLSYEEEAELYVRFATVNKQGALDRFRARIEARDEKALLIQATIREYGGMEIATSNAIEVNHINAVYALERVHDEYGLLCLQETCSVLRAVWGNTTRAWGSQLLHGMSGFWVRYRDVVQYKRLVEKLQLLTPETLIARGVQKRADMEKIDHRFSVGMVILSAYNDGLRRDSPQRLPEWRAKVFHFDETREAAAERGRAKIRKVQDRNREAGQLYGVAKQLREAKLARLAAENGEGQ